MEQLFSSHLTRFPKRGYRATLLAAFLAVALGFSAFFFAPAVHATVSGSTAPAPPPGFKPSAKQDLSQLVGKDPSVHVERITLPAAECAAINKAHPGTAPNCQGLHYWAGASHLPLPHGTQAAAATWYYWSWADYICFGIWPGCTVWSLKQTEDGVENGSSIWQWYTNCTAGGAEGTINYPPNGNGWCGYLYNGGGWPYYGMQFGLNGQDCFLMPWGQQCINHGMRRWINDNGTLGYFSNW